ncbi:hypothetical protein SETIT_2G029700v2 [Setaria italica]|uniref:F-box domain-containing protein n=1 Tax=Setaria italica TaxID=4555 RepID=A0A368PWT9_SETIT|nr:F-box/LRR-repeat protein 13 [Setaria italica]RCV09450.1 hypothetical protein SETIT_2G029700v2 [Setaria italica]
MEPTSSPAQGWAPLTADDCILPKKRKTCCSVQQPAQNNDRISALPDDILIKVLSLMTVMEAAVTACLSTRWRHLWGNVDHLILDKHTFKMQVPENSNNNENPDLWNQEATKFVSKVNEVLHHHNGNGIKKIEVKFPLSSSHSADLDHWVEFAATSGSKTLNLILSGYHGMGATRHAEKYSFPLKHFVDLGGCRLHQLHLSMCSLEIVSAKLSGFCYLDSLSLHRVSVVDSVVLNIMSSCCALRRFGLQRCHRLINMRFAHAKLVDLVVLGCKGLISISIHAEKLKYFSYKGHKVDIEYECTPVLHKLRAFFVKNNECPLDFLGHLPNLTALTLQFPTCLQVSRVLQHSKRFAGLKNIVLCLLTSWKTSIRSVAYLLKDAPLVETLVLQVYGNLQPQSKLKIIWPKKCILGRLHAIRIRGFSGEPELMRLLSFLLKRSPWLKKLDIDTHPHKYSGFNKWKRKKSEDATRCYYARGVALTHLPLEIPSTVTLRVR